jgi:peptidoglycan L-alanyl-D-glutamate endopeptidase CwlK
MRLVEGRRSLARQDHLYAQGRTRPGKIVTWVSSTIGYGHHLPGPDGLGWAMDCCFEGPEPYSEAHQWERYGAACERNGLEWGGRWRRPDRPHSQLARPAPAAVGA